MQVARVVGVAVVSGSTSSRGGDGGGRVVVSLALCGIEIYSLCRRAQGAPLLQVKFYYGVPSHRFTVQYNSKICKYSRIA